MTRAEARTMLRGWLQEEVADDWQDPDLNGYINLGIKEAQKVVVALEPELVKKTYTASLVVPATGKDAIYSYPAGTWAVIELALSGDGVTFGDPLDRISLDRARKGDAGFVPWGPTRFALFPPPSTVVTGGLRAIVVPTLVVAVDTDVLPLQPSLDTLTLKMAERFALRDTGEPTDKIDAEIQEEVQGVPRFFLTSTKPAFVTPVLDRYGD